MLLCSLLEEQASRKDSAGEACPRKSERGREGREEGKESDNKEETLSEIQGRKTATLLERTPMRIATATMPKHLRNARVRPGPVHTSPHTPLAMDQIYPVDAWSMHGLLLFITNDQHLKIKAFYIKTRFLLHLEHQASCFESHQKLMLRQRFESKRFMWELQTAQQGMRGGDRQQRVQC